jgi:ligand-binding sensor domain-containing protein
LWAASRNCIFIFDTRLNLKKIISSPFTEADLAKERHEFVKKILPLSNENVLVYLYDGWHLYSNKTHELTSFKNSPLIKQLKFVNDISIPTDLKKSNQYFPASHFFKVFENYFFCIAPSTDSLLLFDESGKKLCGCFFPFNKYPYVLWSQQVAMIDSSKLLFLFHNYGLTIIAVEWKNNKPLIHSPSALLLETHEYITALRDHQSNWWLATSSEGLEKISPYKQYFKRETLIDQSTGQQAKYEVVSCSRYNNVLWAATYGNGFFETDLSSGKQHQHLPAKAVNDTWANFIWNIRQVSEDTVWVGTQDGMFWYSISSKKFGCIPAYPGKPPALDSVAITTQFVDSRGLVWMGLGKGNGVCYFDNKNKRFVYYPGKNPNAYPLRYPLNIAEDKQGNLWLTNDASSLLVKWNRNTDHFQTISLPSSYEQQPGNFYGILCADDSIIWLGSVTNGLIKFNHFANSVAIYGHDRGLNNSHISSIYEDKQKRLWLTTEGGLSCFDQRTETFINYTAKDGLPVQYSTDFFYYDTSDHRLYSGGQ